MAAALQGPRLHLGETHAAPGHFGLAIAFVAVPGELAAHQHRDQAEPLVPPELRQRSRRRDPCHARERIREPLRACAEDFENFFNAVEEDEEAVAVLNHGLERLNRTLEIITGESAGSVKTLPATWRARLRTLPALLVR